MWMDIMEKDDVTTIFPPQWELPYFKDILNPLGLVMQV